MKFQKWKKLKKFANEEEKNNISKLIENRDEYFNNAILK